MKIHEHVAKALLAWRFLAGLAALAAIAFALALAVSPQLHERIHPNAALAGHECAVTLIASGNYELTPIVPLVVLPQPSVCFATVPALNPIWVPALFVRARVFEHAPPALS